MSLELKSIIEFPHIQKADSFFACLSLLNKKRLCGIFKCKDSHRYLRLQCNSSVLLKAIHFLPFLASRYDRNSCTLLKAKIPFDSLYVVAGIAPPCVHRSVASRTEQRRQADDTSHPCHNQQPAPSLHAVQPLSQPPQTARLALWEEQRIAKQHLAKLPIPTSEQLAPGHKSEWKLWKSLNRLCMGMGRSKTNLSKWSYVDTADTACECGTSEQTMQHLLRCPLLENECSLEDLATANEKALHCARAWPNI